MASLGPNGALFCIAFSQAEALPWADPSVKQLYRISSRVTLSDIRTTKSETVDVTVATVKVTLFCDANTLQIETRVLAKRQFQYTKPAEPVVRGQPLADDTAMLLAETFEMW